MSGLSALPYVKSVTPGGVPQFNFSQIKSPDVCQTIINECQERGRFATVKALAWFVATTAIAYFAYLAASSLIATYGILTAGVTALALVSLFPITLIAAAVPIATFVAAASAWKNSHDYSDQETLGRFHKAELLSPKPARLDPCLL
jgi:hypothetical protein